MLSHAVAGTDGAQDVTGEQGAGAQQSDGVGISQVGTPWHSGTTISQQLLFAEAQSRFSKRSMNFPARAGENVVRVQRVATNVSRTQ